MRMIASDTAAMVFAGVAKPIPTAGMVAVRRSASESITNSNAAVRRAPSATEVLSEDFEVPEFVPQR